MKPDLEPYAGRWVALVGEEVAGVGATAVAAAHAARHNRPRDRFTIRYVEAPGGRPLALPGLLQALRPLLAQEPQPIYLVGGTVRDALLGRVSQDLDFVVPHGAVQLSFRVADALGVPVYVLDKERDVGRVILAQNQTCLDFTRFRGPDLEADLRDRDFTINAIALPATAETDASLIDPTNGRVDLAARVIRPVHARALADDPVRALRALRLALSLDFELAPETVTAVTAAAGQLQSCSRERIRDELLKLLQTGAPDQALAQLHQLGLLHPILPEIDAMRGVTPPPPHHEDVFAHTVSVLRWLARLEEGMAGSAEEEGVTAVWTQLADFIPGLQAHRQRTVDGGVSGRTLLRLGALYHDAGKPETRTVAEDGRIRFLNHDKVGGVIAARQLTRLKLSNQAVAHVRLIVEGHMRPLLLSRDKSAVSRRAVYRYFRRTQTAGLDIALLSLADHLATYNGMGEEEGWRHLLAVVAQLLNHYFERYTETISPPPLVNGRDLIRELHLSPGPEVGRLLRLIQENQAAGLIHSRAEALQFARQCRA